MTSVAAPRSRPMRMWSVALWTVQIVLALAFGLSGLMKVTTPYPELILSLGWVADLPPAFVRFIGVCEIAAAIGLVFPAGSRVVPVLTPLAALGLVLLMAFAATFHIARGELDAVPVNVVLAALAAFVAWGRLRKRPLHPR